MSILVKTAWSLRLAREADISALKNLIALSSRGLRANYYSAAQIEGALGSVFGVDRQLIRDATYFAGVAGDRLPESSSRGHTPSESRGGTITAAIGRIVQESGSIDLTHSEL